MKILVSKCAECPFKKVGAEIRCKLDDTLLLLGKEAGGPDYISAETVHPNCKLLTERVVVVIDTKTMSGRGDVPLEAFIGNRVKLEDSRRGVVVGKYRNAKMAGVYEKAKEKFDQETLGDTWYQVLLDGHKEVFAPRRHIVEIIKERADYNYNQEFEFYFGFGEADDEE